MSKLFTILCLLAYFAFKDVSTREPGFEAVMTEKAMKFLSQATKDMMIDYLKQPKNITKKFQISTVDVELSRIKFSNIDDKFASHLYFRYQVGLEHRIKNMSLIMNAKYEAKLHPVAVIGYASMKIYKLYMSTIMRLKNAQGKLAMSVISCDANVGHVDLEFVDDSNGAKLLNELVTPEFNLRLKTQLQQELCKFSEREFVPLLSHAFTNIPTDAPLFQNYFYDYSLTDEPNVQNVHVATSHKGQTFLMLPGNQRDSQVPFEAPVLANRKYDTSEGQKMVYVYMSNYSVSTLMYFLWKTGKLDYNITKEKASKNQAPFLRTDCPDDQTCASSLYPSLKEKYPGGSLEIFIKSVKSPDVRIVRKKINITNTGSILANVRKADKSLSFLFSADADLNMEMNKFRLKDYSFYTNVVVTDYKFRNFKSSSKEITVDSMNMLMSFAKGAFLEPDINKLLSNGLVLPQLLNFDMVNGTVEAVDDLIIASTDFCTEKTCSQIESGLKNNYEDYYSG